MGIIFPSDRPADHELEITLIGGGNGYGECLLLHFGKGKWGIIDSLKDPKTKELLPLSYLREIGVTLESDVELIVATHWHDDHISGLSEVVAACPNAAFVCSAAMEKSQFLTLLGLGGHISNSQKSGVHEFGQILHELKKRKSTIKKAIDDRLLYEYEVEPNFYCKVTSLSPSDATVAYFDDKLPELITTAREGRQIQANLSNHTSVALLIEFGPAAIILGSDLEITTDHSRGWQAVMKTHACPDQNRVELFKVPHHGSENGYHLPLWDEALRKPFVLAALTPYAKGKKKLPAQTDIQRIKKHTPNLWLTSSPHLALRPGGKKRDTRVTRALKDTGTQINERRFHAGQVRCRIAYQRGIPPQAFTPSMWQIDTFGEAVHVDQLALVEEKGN